MPLLVVMLNCCLMPQSQCPLCPLYGQDARCCPLILTPGLHSALHVSQCVSPPRCDGANPSRQIWPGSARSWLFKFALNPLYFSCLHSFLSSESKCNLSSTSDICLLSLVCYLSAHSEPMDVIYVIFYE